MATKLLRSGGRRSLASEQRTPRGRDLADRALARLVVQLGEHVDEIVVFGGLTPGRVTTGAPAAHVGTTDVDLFVNLSVIYDRDEDDFSWLERGLLAGGFTSVGDQTWQWWVHVDGRPVRVDLLTDVGDSRFQNVVLPGCARVTAWNVPGPAPVGIRSQLMTLPTTHEGAIAVRFATVGPTCSRRRPEPFDVAMRSRPSARTSMTSPLSRSTTGSDRLRNWPKPFWRRCRLPAMSTTSATSWLPSASSPTRTGRLWQRSCRRWDGRVQTWIPISSCRTASQRA